MRDLWDGSYVESPVWDETARALISSANLQPGMRVLDVGSAGGGTLFPALERIGETGSIVGIEVDREWVEWLQKEISKRGIRNAENRLMDGKSMTFADAAFDAVIMGMVGLDDDYDFGTGRVINGAPLLREVFRVLKPGRCLHSSSWLRQEDSDWMRELLQRHLPDCTKYGYFPGTEEGYAAVLETVGFECVRVTPFEGQYTLEDPAEWMAGIRHVWKEELALIRADPSTLRAFESDALDLLAGHCDEGGKIAYRRSAVLVSGRKPA